MIRKLPFYSDCVGWPRHRLGALNAIVAASRNISRKTFMAKVDPLQRAEIEAALGYDRDFPITRDWHVGYHSMPSTGIYYLTHSAIEYVFATPEQIEKAQSN